MQFKIATTPAARYLVKHCSAVRIPCLPRVQQCKWVSLPESLRDAGVWRTVARFKREPSAVLRRHALGTAYTIYVPVARAQQQLVPLWRVNTGGAVFNSIIPPLTVAVFESPRSRGAWSTSVIIDMIL